MGYGWTTSNLTTVNFTYNGSIQYFPSLTKAETMAILMYLAELKLVVCFIKVKAHSNDHYNDRADALAKVDKDVRKCVGTILNYRRIETHLNHQSLGPIKQATKDNLIDWSLSAKWFDYNGRNDTTTIAHSKDTKWKIRCSTFSLPTKDILHQNFPLLLPADKLNCFFCNNILETNDHFWTCLQLRTTIVNIFKKLGQDLIDILANNADKHPLLINDSIKYSKTFRWAFQNEPIHPVVLLLMRSYITRDLVGIFRSHFNTTKAITTFYYHSSIIVV
ncbi:uncharacterized protein OCT59_020051 [Rhizophagus irregularis]|uniref:uncharacterized protein n=1 Tax=Rhizophagus irregularis TaxID=588596 RepID=UPI00331A48DE|nr:hypothetical protein OCT59_020051 [Rhizophagus irregularis]